MSAVHGGRILIITGTHWTAVSHPVSRPCGHALRSLTDLEHFAAATSGVGVRARRTERAAGNPPAGVRPDQCILVGRLAYPSLRSDSPNCGLPSQTANTPSTTATAAR